jgi:hypothetical protein
LRIDLLPRFEQNYKLLQQYASVEFNSKQQDAAINRLLK